MLTVVYSVRIVVGLNVNYMRLKIIDVTNNDKFLFILFNNEEIFLYGLN